MDLSLLSFRFPSCIESWLPLKAFQQKTTSYAAYLMLSRTIIVHQLYTNMAPGRLWITWWKRPIGRRDFGGSSRAVKGFPMRKCPGVNASIPFDGSGSGVRGLELRHASICARTVVSSSYLSLTSPTIFLRCCLNSSLLPPIPCQSKVHIQV